MGKTEWELVEHSLDRLTTEEKLRLMERLAVKLRSEAAALPAAEQLRALEQLRQEMAALAIHNPADGFTNRSHDRALYRDPR